MTMTRERAYEIIKELLKAEEATDSANLTREERNELHQIVEDAMTGVVITGENAKHITVEGTNSTMRMNVPTPEGELRAYIDINPDCPAIMILLNPAETNSVIDIATAEYSEENGLRAIIWGDAMTEDYTHVENIKNLSECRDQFIDAEMRD